MATIYSDRYSDVQLDNDFQSGLSDRQILIKQGDKVSVRLPNQTYYGSIPPTGSSFDNPIYFTITLKREGR